MACVAAGSQDSSVSTVNRLLDRRPINQGSITGNTTTFSILKNVQTQLRGPPSLQRRFVPREQSGRGVKLTTHLNIVSRLRVKGALPSLFRTPS